MKLSEQEFNDFIERHAGDDTARLRMKYRGDDSGYIEAITQIELRRKALGKFTDAEGRSMRPATLHSALAVEQATSAAIARFHASLIAEGSSVLDMTMGMGIDTRAFADIDRCTVTAIERDPDLAAASAKNYAHSPDITVINADSVDWLAKSAETFDVIFIDPARRDTDGRRVCNIHDCTPDAAAIMPLMLDHAPTVMIKLSPMLDVTATLRELPATSALYVVEERGECRELLAVVNRGYQGQPRVTVVDRRPLMSFTPDEEAAATADYGTPSLGDMIYEPSPATMKAAPFRLLCRRFGAKAISPNSHIYFSEKPLKSFPGKEYRVTDVFPYSSATIRRLSRSLPAASVAVRNFPESAERLRARLKVRESDTVRLLATTCRSGDRILLLLEHPGH